jgi:hypothetical protein
MGFMSANFAGVIRMRQSNCPALRDTWLMQIGVSTREAAGFLGMSEKTLRDVYGHHHPEYLQFAAKAIGTMKPISLVNSLVRRQPRAPLSSQATEKIGGPGRTRTCNQTVMSGTLSPEKQEKSDD